MQNTQTNYVLCLGDSITQLGYGVNSDGWISLLEHHFNGKVDIRHLENSDSGGEIKPNYSFINRGFSGFSSAHAVKHILPNLSKSLQHFKAKNTCSKPKNSSIYTKPQSKIAKIDQKQNPKTCQNNSTQNNLTQNQLKIKQNSVIKLATIFYGANDSVLKSCKDNSQHVPVDIFKGNIGTILNFFNDDKDLFQHLEKVILITLPKYDYNNWKVATRKKYSLDFYPETKRNNKNSKLYRNAILEIAEESKNCGSVTGRKNPKNQKLGKKFNFEVVVADMFQAMDEIDDFEKYLIDGLHFNSRGNGLLFEVLEGCF